METLRVVRDLEEARHLWELLMPRDVVSDLWEVRSAFQRHFRRPLHFIVGETGGRPTGLLPLSWVEESGNYAFFPGETWQGKTWLEQNLIPGEEPGRYIGSIPGPYHLRYLSPRNNGQPTPIGPVDEVGYLFRPPSYGFDLSGYFERFSGKSLKRIRREIDAIASRGIAWRTDDPGDFELMVAMNRSRFGNRSYFSDPRFRKGFTEMIHYFRERQWLRVTTALIEGEVAAVDVGVLYNGTYTLMAGGTNPAFPGIAKVINMHHLQWACEKRVQEVDFLCGDFNWKKMFHLQERPLFLASRSAVRAA